MKKAALPKAVRLTVLLAILTIAAAVVTANADSHLPDCKADAGCLSKLYEKWKTITAADMQAMIDDGADVNAKYNDGNTPVHTAAVIANVEVISVLAKAGADVNAKDKDGFTPFHAAAVGGDTEVFLILIKVGADVNAKSNYGFTPLHLAASFGHAEDIPVLIKIGADVNAKDKNGWTPLDFAKYKKHWAAIRALEDAGGKCQKNC